MPTGYTCVITENPEITFAQFALRCARAFGALIEMRDDPLDAAVPTEFEEDEWHLRELLKAEARARELEVMTLEQASEQNDIAHAGHLKSWLEAQKRYDEENALYRAMLSKVEAWTPPTKDHEGLKKFMAEQITVSMHTYEWEKPTKGTPQEWLNQARERAARDVAYHAEHWKKERENVTQRTAWVRDLRASLSNTKGEP